MNVLLIDSGSSPSDELFGTQRISQTIPLGCCTDSNWLMYVGILLIIFSYYHFCNRHINQYSVFIWRRINFFNDFRWIATNFCHTNVLCLVPSEGFHISKQFGTWTPSMLFKIKFYQFFKKSLNFLIQFHQEKIRLLPNAPTTVYYNKGL